MQSFTAEQNKYLEDFGYQLEQTTNLFGRLSRFEGFRETNSEMQQVAKVLGIRVSRFENLKRKNINSIKKGKFSGFLSDTCSDLSDAINILENYYNIKINELRAIYSNYEKLNLSFNVPNFLTTVTKIKTILDDFTKYNYFIKELQYEPELTSRPATLTKTQLTKASACAEILELQLSQSIKPKNIDIQKVFENFNLCINGLEATCKVTIESLNQKNETLLDYKHVFELAENKSVQTIISGKIQSANIAPAVQDVVQDKSQFLRSFFNFFSCIKRAFVSSAVQLSAEEAKEREIRFTMFRK